MTTNMPRIDAPGFLRGLAATLLLVVAALLLGAAAAQWLYDPEVEWMSRKGPWSFTRRCMLVAGVLLAPLYVWAVGTFRWSDHGWRSYDGYQLSRPAWTFLPVGMVMGLLTLGGVMAFALINGSRTWDVEYAPWKLSRKLLLEYPLKALVVGVLEETVMRGLLLRGLTRRVGVVTAIGLTSILFALLHLMAPADGAFEGGVWSLLAAAMPWRNPDPLAWLVFLNLTVMSVLLCVVVLRTGSIWLAAGLHAGWVWIKLANGVLADSARGMPDYWMYGASSDHTDGVATLALLGGLTGLVLWSLRGAGRTRDS